MNKIIKLIKYLNKNNLTKEAQLLHKIAAPVIPDGAFNFPPSEEDQPLRLKQLKDDDQFRPRTKNDVNLEDTSQWIRAFDEIGSNVVLIGMDFDKMSEKHKRQLAQVFGIDIKTFKNMIDFNRSDVIDVAGSKDFTSIDKFFEVFPYMKDKISEPVAKAQQTSPSEIDWDEIILFIYNVGTGAPLSGLFQFAKTPEYLAHDILHIEENADEDQEFVYELNMLLSSMAEKYKLEEDSEEEDSESWEDEKPQTLTEYYQEYPGRADNMEYKEDLIQELFSTIYGSDPTDYYADVYSRIMMGYLDEDYDIDSIPDEIGAYNIDANYVISPEDKTQLHKEIIEFIQSAKEQQKDHLEFLKGNIGLFVG
jgi:hypothetical protein